MSKGIKKGEKTICIFLYNNEKLVIPEGILRKFFTGEF